jgi:hypothetical protein
MDLMVVRFRVFLIMVYAPQSIIANGIPEMMWMRSRNVVPALATSDKPQVMIR